jgi:hypothetical protein
MSIAARKSAPLKLKQMSVAINLKLWSDVSNQKYDTRWNGNKDRPGKKWTENYHVVMTKE